MTTAADTGAIEDALDRLLRDLLRRRGKPTRPLRVFSLADLLKTPIPSRRRAAVDAIIRDPVDGPRRLAVRLLGERLFELVGSTDAMLEVAERVAARDRRNRGTRLAILDSRWDGIGAGTDWWRA